MQKIVLISIVIMTFAIPAAAAAERKPHFALRKVVWWMLAAILLYDLAVVFIYPRFMG
jgi:hypothetical protein